MLLLVTAFDEFVETIGSRFPQRTLRGEPFLGLGQPAGDQRAGARAAGFPGLDEAAALEHGDMLLDVLLRLKAEDSHIWRCTSASENVQCSVDIAIMLDTTVRLCLLSSPLSDFTR
ncbi:hypothetical protein JM78_16385 [Burkholderia pyrrocinia]|nr:hypothetical protein JM78_16385 [Burkholderia pyrrocinia]